MRNRSVELVRLMRTPAVLASIQEILTNAVDFAIATQGAPFDDDEALRTFEESPPGVDTDAKHVLGVVVDGTIVGVVDLIKDFPVIGTAMLGLLIIDGRYRRRGLGRSAAQAVETLVRSWGSCDRIRLGVVTTNTPALLFWQEMDYKLTGDSRPWQKGTINSKILVMEKLLTDLIEDVQQVLIPLNSLVDQLQGGKHGQGITSH